jgi:hypothetical protein
MLLYNVTVKISTEKQAEWLKWMREIHIPEVLATGVFSHHRLCKMVMPVDEDNDGETYAIQYFCADMDTLNNYFDKYAPTLQRHHTKHFGGHFVAFRTVLEIVE